MVVDDNSTNLAVYRRLLHDVSDADVRPFTSSSDALATCVEHEPDLILVDYRMPPPNGLQFIEAFRAARPGATTPIVMLTGEQDREVRHRALESGADDFLNKPVDPIEFKRTDQESAGAADEP